MFEDVHEIAGSAIAWVWIVAVGLAISAAVGLEKELWRRFARGCPILSGGGRASQEPPPVV